MHKGTIWIDEVLELVPEGNTVAIRMRSGDHIIHLRGERSLAFRTLGLAGRALFRRCGVNVVELRSASHD